MGQAQSQGGLTDGAQNLEMVADKVKKLKSQGEQLAQALFTRVDELGVECQKALEESNHSSHVGSMVAYRLDSFAGLLDDAMLKLQGTEKSSTETNRGEQMFLSLTKRIEELEASNANLEKLGADLQKAHEESSSTKQLESDVQKLESSVNAMAGTIFQLKHDIGETKKKALAIQDVESRLEALSIDMKASLACRLESSSSSRSRWESETPRSTTPGQPTASRINVRKMKSRLKRLKQQVCSVKTEKDTAVLLLSKKVSSLEKWRDILNKNQPEVEARKNGLRQFCESAKKEFEILNDQVTQLQRPAVGFTAEFSEDRTIDKESQVNKLFDIITNVGDCFKKCQGHFVAPYDGLYCFCVKLHQQDPENFTASLMAKDIDGEAHLAFEIPMHFNSPHSAMCVLGLPANRRISVKISDADYPVTLLNTFSFSGWSIKYD